MPVTTDNEGNMIVQRGELPAMTIRPGTVNQETWDMLASQAQPAQAPAVPVPSGPGGITPDVSAPPPNLPAPNPTTAGSPMLYAGQKVPNAPVVTPPPAAPANPYAGLMGTSPRLMAMEDKAFSDAKTVNADQAELEGLKAIEETNAQKKIYNQIASDEKNNQIKREALASALDAAELKRQAAVDSQMNMKVDPGRLMSTKSTSERVGLVLASILGGIGAGLTHGPNMALEVINRAVDQDIDAQKSAIMNGRENVNMHNNTVAQLRSKGLDFDQSVLAAKQIKIEQLKRQMDTLASEYKTPEGELRAKAFNAAMDEKLAELKLQQDNTAKARAVQILDKMPAPGGKALNDGTAKGLGEANGAVKTMNDLLGQFNQKADHVGAWLASYLPTTDASKYRQRAAVAAQTIGTYLEGGKLSDANVPMYLDMLPQPGESKATAQNKRDAIVQAIAARQQAEKEALAGAGYNVRGIKDANPQINFTPTGR